VRLRLGDRNVPEITELWATLMISASARKPLKLHIVALTSAIHRSKEV